MVTKGRVAIIPARGGSKRIPGKNVKYFCGKPIICYSIAAALESEIFSEVMVSTDDEKIASIAHEAGASVPFMRSKETSDDHSTVADVLREVLDGYATDGKSFESMCCIYPTAPFVTSVKIREAYELLDDAKASMVCAVTEFGFPPLRGFVNHCDCLEYRFPEYAKVRSQDLEPMYQDAGQFYIYNSLAMENATLQVDRMFGYVVPQTEVQDIDNLVDWKLAELKYELMVCQAIAGDGD